MKIADDFKAIHAAVEKLHAPGTEQVVYSTEVRALDPAKVVEAFRNRQNFRGLGGRPPNPIDV